MPEQAPQTDVTLKGDPKLIVEPGVDVTGAMAGDEAPVAEAQNPTSSQVRG